MSRGRHRHSSVLGRIVPPVATGTLVLAAVAALVASPDPLVARSVGVAAVCAAIGMGLLLRQRDKAAREAAQLAIVRRLRAEERFEEQLAEAEYAAEVAEERATRFGRRLTAEKSRLAKAETEIARLLRERAVMVADHALKETEAARRALEATRPKYPVSPAAYVRAAAALRHLERQAEVAEARRASDERAQIAIRPKTPPVVSPLRPVSPARPLTVATETSMVPAGRQRLRPTGSGANRGSGFSFFGRSGAVRAAVRAAAPAPAVGDLADVVGDEALAATAHHAQPTELRAVEAQRSEVAPIHTRPAVVDLTAEDETQPLEVAQLRASHS